MARGEVSVFDELFSYACPRFITAVAPSFDAASLAAAAAAGSTTQQAYRAQLSLFLAQVKAQVTLPLLKQYLLLYSSIDIQVRGREEGREGGERAVRQRVVSLWTAQPYIYHATTA